MFPLDTHPNPVNLQAAKIFWKAPWWAQLPQQDKEELTHSAVKLEDLVDVFSPPPPRKGGREQEIVDLRGKKVKSKNTGLVALVLGYAFAKSIPYKREIKKRLWWQGHNWVFSESKGEKRWRNEHRWYAFFLGEVQIIVGHRWGLAGNYEPITPSRIIPFQGYNEIPTHPIRHG